jgi:hypothetical protein
MLKRDLYIDFPHERRGIDWDKVWEQHAKPDCDKHGHIVMVYPNCEKGYESCYVCGRTEKIQEENVQEI